MARSEEEPVVYHAIIGKHDVGLFGSQQQLLTIARAVLKRPKIPIVYEVTSILDALTAKRFAQFVDKLKGAATVVYANQSDWRLRC